MNVMLRWIVLVAGFSQTLDSGMTQASEDATSAETQATQESGSAAAEQFVGNVGNEIISVLVNKGQPLSARKETFRGILYQNFDMKSIGKFVLARYWKRLEADQKQEYLKLFEDAVVENYASQFDNYNNEKLQVTGSYQTKDSGLVVQSKILRPAGAPPLQVDWKVFHTKNGFKVLDIVVNGVSMSITLRSEYMNVYTTRHGIDGLLTYLQEKITQDQAKSNGKGA